MARKQNTTNTISDKDWNSLTRRARKANPGQDDLTDTRAVHRRTTASEQKRNARWN